jgi:hypothetical protein
MPSMPLAAAWPALAGRHPDIGEHRRGRSRSTASVKTAPT